MPHRRRVLAFVLLVAAQVAGIHGLALISDFSLFGETPPPVSTGDAVLGLLLLAAALALTLAAGRVLDRERPWRASIVTSAIAGTGWALYLVFPTSIARVPPTAILATGFAVLAYKRVKPA